MFLSVHCEDRLDLNQGAGSEHDEKTTNWRALPGGRGRAWHLTEGETMRGAGGSWAQDVGRSSFVGPGVIVLSGEACAA